MKRKQFITMTTLSITAGFVAGLIIGKNVRQNVPSNVSTSYNGGVVTIKADVGNALKSGITDTINNLF
jgi:hypothetical protein